MKLHHKVGTFNMWQKERWKINNREVGNCYITIKPTHMAQINSPFSFTGSLQNLSAYKRRGSDKIILRTKGGATKVKIKTSPNFEITRRYNSEFGGCSNACKWIREMLHPFKQVTDFNLVGPINSLLKGIQVLDTESELGQRQVQLSRNPRLLEGFNFNRTHLFESIVQNPVYHTLNKASLQAMVNIPALLPDVNFTPPGNLPLYRFMVSLSIIPDWLYTDRGYRMNGDYSEADPVHKYTDWFQTGNGSPSLHLELQLPNKPVADSYSCMLALGIGFGMMKYDLIQPVKYMGGGKIVAIG